MGETETSFIKTASRALPVRGLRAVLRSTKRLLSHTVPRSEKDYATHIPILLGIAQSMKVERVLELGCGTYSTGTFLNPIAFPSLTKLDSMETDRDWLYKVLNNAGSDSRLHTHFVSTAMHVMIEKTNLEDYDVIFVDDSQSSEERSATIRAIAARQPRRAAVVIHDFEVPAYRQASRSFRHKVIFKAFNPQTGVVWNDERKLKSPLERTAGVIKRYANYVEPDNLIEWRTVLTR